jgi:hypothetical protein
MTEWQPIETAPKEPRSGEHGPTILLWLADNSMEPYRVNVGFWDYLFDDWGRANPAEGDSTFWVKPTHWMPLPEPPK